MVMTPWHETTQARVIFASCLNDPPVKKLHTTVFTMSADQWTAYDRDDRRVAALDALHETTFKAAEQLGGPFARIEACAISVDQMLDALIDATRIAAKMGRAVA